jgi:signal transduction histidine kinase
VDFARTTRGFGLGLSTVQRIARLHNGDVEVESAEGKGSAFRMVLPNLTFGENPTIPSRKKLSSGG